MDKKELKKALAELFCFMNDCFIKRRTDENAATFSHTAGRLS